MWVEDDGKGTTRAPHFREQEVTLTLIYASQTRLPGRFVTLGPLFFPLFIDFGDVSYITCK